MNNFYKYISVAAVLLILGCSTQTSVPLSQHSSFIVMKTPVFRYADQGFVHTGKNVTKVEIYSSGTPLMKLEIKADEVCSGNGIFSCMSKNEFNKRFLSMHYPDSIMEHIFRGEYIFEREGIMKSKGIHQHISKTGLYEIDYTVLNGSIVFRDTINNILIKVRNI